MTIELRPEVVVKGLVYLDEIVGENVSVHLERMDEHWYCLIVEDGDRRVSIRVGSPDSYRRKVNATVYEDAKP